MTATAHRHHRVLPLSLALLITGGVMGHAKTASRIVTAQMRRQAVENCRTHAWARRYRDRLAAAVAPWMALSDEQLWRLLPSQDMPRDSSVNRGDGCPNCGQDHYKAPYNPSRWRVDVLGNPWKVTCAHCGEAFPKNDFAAYYQSALDPGQRFRLGAGDPRFLQAAPDTPPAWVDAGSGAKIDAKTWFFAANYAFRLWEEALDMMEKMALVYTLTNDTRYAHKAAVLLDRMADLYPEMDFTPHFRRGMEASTGGSGKGRIQGRIWETWTAQKASLAYDHIYDALVADTELCEFAAAMSERHDTGDKTTPEALVRHIETNLLHEFIAGIRDARIHGNPGMHHYAMTCVAIALDDPQASAQALDWLFAPDGGAIPTILNERLGREGFSDEAALGYASIPARTFFRTAQLLRRYPDYERSDLYAEFPKFRACFTMGAKVRMLDSYTPNWGDGDKCMNFGKTGLTIPLDMALDGFRLYNDPQIAGEAWFANGKTLEGIFDLRPGPARGSEDVHAQLYDPDPEALAAALKEAVQERPDTLHSFNSGGYGMAVLQAPQRQPGHAMALYYGRMAGHGHSDRLTLMLVAHNVVMTPDMGYPLYCTSTWRKRFGWVRHVVSHNTCMVNDTNPASSSWSGKTRLFHAAGPLRVADVDGGDIYAGVSTYRRCLIMVDADPEHSYVLDVFWVRGGRNHRLLQNGGGPQVTHSGLELTPQDRGTYAGADIPYGAEYDGAHNSRYTGTGFSYLENVERATPGDPFWVDWRIVEPRRTMPADWDAHLRVHTLSAVDEVALCDGIPPRYKGNPERLRVMLRSRFGSELETQFLSVLEPYGTTPFIRAVRPLVDRQGDDGFEAAVEVTLANGMRDVILVREQSGSLSAGSVTMDGRVGLCRFAEDRPVLQTLICGTRLAAADCELTPTAAAHQGTILGWSSDTPRDTRLKLDTPLPQAVVAGHTILVQNNGRSDASYRIEKIIDRQTVSIGDVSLVEAYIDRSDYTKGLVHTIAPGDAFVIPFAATWHARP